VQRDEDAGEADAATPVADDTSRVVNAGSGKVLDVADCGTADGAVVRQWSWLNNNCQQWRFQPV